MYIFLSKSTETTSVGGKRRQPPTHSPDLTSSRETNQSNKKLLWLLSLFFSVFFVSSAMAWIWQLLSLLPSVVLVCGGSLTNSVVGNFTSPGYDGVSNYSRNLNCEWTLSNPHQGNSSIYIHFEDFYLESHQDCQFDVLEFRAGESNQGARSPIHLQPSYGWRPPAMKGDKGL